MTQPRGYGAFHQATREAILTRLAQIAADIPVDPTPPRFSGCIRLQDSPYDMTPEQIQRFREIVRREFPDLDGTS